MKTFKKTLALFLATLMIVSAFAAYSVFATTNENEPAAVSEPAAQDEPATPSTDFDIETREGVEAFYIDNLADFLAFNQEGIDNYKQYYGKNVILTDDIDMQGYTWTKNATFRGKFDGKGHTISNLSLTTPMFGNVASGSIKNVKFIGGGIESANDNTAFFATQTIETTASFTFEKVDVDVTVKGGALSTAVFVSRHNGAGSTLIIKDCTNASDVSGTARVGGYVSTVDISDDTKDTPYLKIENSTFTGKVECTHRVGGSNINYSENGAFVAYVDNLNKGKAVDLVGCSFSGELIGTGIAVGGAVGYLVSGSIKITDCESAGTITTASKAGGFVGTASGTVEISGSTFSSDGKIVADGGSVGGFVAGADSGSTVSITKSVSDGEIETKAQINGGFVGYVNKATTVEIKESIFLGSINSSGAGCGGFIGRIYTSSTATLTDCIAAGEMKAVGSYSSSMLGYVQSSATLEKCVSAGISPASTNGYGELYYSINNTANAGTVTVIDCYAATNNYGACGKHTADTKNTHVIKYGESTVDEVKTIATKDGAILTAANFKAVCPELAANDWVVTTKTVTYGTDLNVPEILPATVATMLGRTVISESPVNAEQWHVKDNGDTVDVRFIGSIKEDAAHLAKYDNVGIEITVVLKGTEDENLIGPKKKYNSTAVYTSMYTDVDGVDAIIAEDGTYLFGANMRGFMKNATYEVTFTAYATYNGVDIYDYDGATTITVENGAIAE